MPIFMNELLIHWRKSQQMKALNYCTFLTVTSTGLTFRYLILPRNKKVDSCVIFLALVVKR